MENEEKRGGSTKRGGVEERISRPKRGRKGERGMATTLLYSYRSGERGGGAGRTPLREAGRPGGTALFSSPTATEGEKME